MKLGKIAAIGFLLASTACTSVESLRDVEPNASSFNTMLAAEYLAFAQSEADQFDWVDSYHFVDKGYKASQDADVQPEDPSVWWNLEKSQIAELLTARSELIGYLNKNKTNKPAESARLQLLYDCWVEQSEENNISPDTTTCKDEFNRLISGIKQPTPKPVAKKPKPAPAQNDKQKLVDKIKGVIYFGFDSHTVNDEGKNVISNITNFLSDKVDYSISLTGHADSVDDDSYNQSLSQKRAGAVKSEFVGRGIDGKIISTDAKGEAQPAVDKGDNAREALNRRVEIEIK